MGVGMESLTWNHYWKYAKQYLTFYWRNPNILKLNKLHLTFSTVSQQLALMFSIGL